MADADAEAAFLSSMQAMNNAGAAEYEHTGGATIEQIDSSSSDEYDPAQEVQNITMSPRLQFQAQSNQISSVTPSNGDASRAVSTPANSSFVPADMSAVGSLSDTQTQGDNQNEALEDNSAHQSEAGYSPATAVQSDVLPNLTTSAVESNVGVSTYDDSAALQKANDQPYTSAKSPATITMPKARLPHDRVGQLEDRIKEDERGDIDAWLNLIDDHRKRGKLEETRRVYERFFTVFPIAAEQWVAYTQFENEANNRAAVESIFNKTLKNIPSYPLWSAYLDHIRRYFNISADKTGSASQINHSAYEAVIEAVGIDKEAGKLWQDYIQFIKSGPGVLGGSNWQDQQKMDLLRKVYQRAICTPTQAVEGLWREYNAFEMGLNKLTGRKFLQDQSPAYMTARSSYMELQNVTRELKRTTLPALPPVPGFDGDVEYMKQVDIWKRWVQWEKDDPLVLKQDESEKYKARIIFVYKQALMALQFWPEMWFDAVEFCFNNDLETQGNELLAQGISANPESCLLAFKLADRLELTTTNGNDDESKKRRGDIVREPYDKVLDALYELVAKAMAREARDIGRVENHFSAIQTDFENGTDQVEGDPDNEETEQKKDSERMKRSQIDIVKSMAAVQIRLLHKTISHAWIALMRAMRRIQGKGKLNALVGGSRQVFTDARKRGRITSDAWIAAAMDEYHAFEAEAAKRIFERGLKLFPEDETFALEYIRHLIATNDHTNARVVFETAVGRLSQKPETTPKAKPLYAYFHDFESRYGELSQIVKLEKRMSETFPDDARLASFSQRFSHEGFDPTTVRPIISPVTQTRPKSIPMPSIELTTSTQTSPPNHFIPTVNSPKRALPLEESDNDSNRPRKLLRGESPLKGAAGRRLDQQKRNRQPPEMSYLEGQSNTHPLLSTPLPRDVLFLLSIIPKSTTYHATKFNPQEIVRLIRDTHIPSSVSQLRPPPPQNGVGAQQMVAIPQAQYNGKCPNVSQGLHFALPDQKFLHEFAGRRSEDMTRIWQRS